MKIPFYKRFQPAEQLELMESALIQGDLSSRGAFAEKIQEHFKIRDRIRNMLLVTSASSALELALLTIAPEPGAEFTLRGEGAEATVHPVAATTARVTDGSAEIALANPYEAQAPFIRIEALHGCAP